MSIQIAMIGTGRVAQALAQGWVRAGHTITFGSRRPGEATGAAVSLPGPVLSISDAVAKAPVIVLAVPFTAIEDALGAAGPLDGKTVIGCTNPLPRDWNCP